MSPRTSVRRDRRSLATLVVIALAGSILFAVPASSAEPAAPRWHDLDERVRPPSASDASLVYDEARHELLLFGGVGNDGPVGTWVRRGESWVRLTPEHEPSPRYGSSIVYDSVRQEIVLFGGWGASPTGGGNSTNAETWIWNGTNWRLAETNVAPPSRAFAAAGFDRTRGNMVLFGGITGDGTGSATMFNDTWTWDGTEWHEETPETSPGRRHSMGSAFDAARGELVIFGGSRDLSEIAPSNPCEIRDPIGNSCVVNLPSSEPQPSSVIAETWVWNGQNWTERTPEHAPLERMNPRMAYDAARQQTLLFGGVHPSRGASTDTWVWNGTDWTELTPATHPSHRFGMVMASDPDSGRVLAFGGHQVTNYARDTWGWDGETWTLLDQPPTPEPRYYAAYSYDSVREEMVVFAGDGHRRHEDTWVYDGTDWIRRNPATAPPARVGAASAFDVERGEMVVFGGYGGRDLDDTWLWDGTDWRPTNPETSPSARRHAAMVYDPIRKETVLFGGAHYLTSGECPVTCDPISEFGDTWVWNGSDWAMKDTPVAPPPLSNVAMTFDEARGEVVLFGGIADNTFSAETWTWDGTSWTQEEPATVPVGRSDAAMTYDPLVERVVMFSGLRSGSSQADVWLWDGADWTEVTPAVGPRTRMAAGLAFVPELGGSLLFGGQGGGPRDDTWLLDLAGVSVIAPLLGFTEATATEGQYSDPSFFEARLTDADGVPLANETVAFELSGAESTRSFPAVTDDDGIARVAPVLSESPGPYELTVSYMTSGDVVEDIVSFLVNREDSALVTNVEGKGGNRQVRAHLSDLDTSSTGIPGALIEFYSGAEVIGSAVTDEGGVARFKPPSRYLGGKNKLEARFAGNDYYEASSTEGAG